MAGADVEQRGIGREGIEDAQHRGGEEAQQDVNAVARAAPAENGVQYD